jgi:acyl-CoA synthetase (NDP forming)
VQESGSFRTTHSFEPRNPIFWKNRIYQIFLYYPKMRQEIRFFGKIGFLKFRYHPKIEARNPIFWKNLISQWSGNFRFRVLEVFNKELPQVWSASNPVDIIRDVNTACYQKTVSICLEDPQVDAVLVILTPKAMTSSLLETTQAIVELADQSPKPILACWMGGAQVEEYHRLFVQARLPEFHTPEAAVEGFYYLAAYYQNQQLLVQTPGPQAHLESPDVEGARLIIESVLAERRKVEYDLHLM